MTSPPPRVRRTNWRRRFVIGLVSLAAFLVAGEIGLRIAGYPRVAGIRWIVDDELAAIPAPNQEATVFTEPDEAQPERLPIRVRINDQSLRGADMPRAKSAGERRVIVVGDSLTFGAGVGEDETYPAVLERALRENEAPAATRVVNAGVNGWSTWNYRRWIESRGLALEPDVLLVGLYYGNDLEPPPARRGLGSASLENALRRTATFDFLLDLYRDHLWKRVRAWRSGTSVADIEAELEAYAGTRETQRTQEEQIELWKKNALPELEAIRALARDRGVSWMVVMIPTIAACRRPKSPTAYRWLLTELATRHIDTIDLHPVLQPKGDDAWLAWNRGHLNAIGCRMAGDAIAKRLAAQGWHAR